ncbi:MAG: hypothetical protein J6J35_01250 [Alphaproteobacteria bacterium]|nr:hypothetical protein [Alphaproteobacteria bacterium]
MKKLFNKTTHLIRLGLQPSYRRKQQLKRGRKLWLILNKNLPQATGNAFDDEPRLERFKVRISTLPSLDQQALKKWLEYQLKELKRTAPEDITYLVEKHEATLRQIYQEHLDLIP